MKLIYTLSYVCFFLLYFVTVAGSPKVMRPFLPHRMTQIFPSILTAMPVTKRKIFVALHWSEFTF